MKLEEIKRRFNVLENGIKAGMIFDIFTILYESSDYEIDLLR